MKFSLSLYRPEISGSVREMPIGTCAELTEVKGVKQSRITITIPLNQIYLKIINKLNHSNRVYFI